MTKFNWNKISFKGRKDKEREKSWAEQGITGATIGEWDRLMVLQNYSCAICGSRKRKLCLDHNHSTGNIRGILCSTCNYYLGWFEKDNRLLKAFNYLRTKKTT